MKHVNQVFSNAVASIAAFALGIFRDIYPAHKGHVCWQCQASNQGLCDIVVQLHSNLLHPCGPGIRIWNTSPLKETARISSMIFFSIWHMEIEKIQAPINDKNANSLTFCYQCDSISTHIFYCIDQLYFTQLSSIFTHTLPNWCTFKQQNWLDTDCFKSYMIVTYTTNPPNRMPESNNMLIPW